MKAMLFAAGTGSRLGQLTAKMPKPLLPIQGQPVIVRLLRQLARAQCTEIVINVSYQAEQIMQTLGDGSQFGVSIDYAYETTPLETGGGLIHAQQQLGTDPVLLVNADIVCDYDFSHICQHTLQAAAHLVMVSPHADGPSGDFALDAQTGRLHSQGAHLLVFSGIAIIDIQALNCVATPPPFSLGPIYHRWARSAKLTGEYYTGPWYDIGTASRYARAQQYFRAPPPTFIGEHG